MSDAVRYLNYANERSAENDWGISCWFCAVKVTQHAQPCSHKITYSSHAYNTLIEIKHQGTTVRRECGLLSAVVPLKINFLCYQTFVLLIDSLQSNQQYSLLKAAWLKGHWCWTLSPDTFNLKQSTLVWLTRPSADRRQNKTHCFLFQDCALVRLLCVCVRMCIKHYIIVSLQVKNSPVRAAADLLGAVQSKDITVGLFMWEYDDLLTL